MLHDPEGMLPVGGRLTMAHAKRKEITYANLLLIHVCPFLVDALT